MKTRILCDSSTGIDFSLPEYSSLERVCMPIMFGEEEYIDGVTINNQQFFEKLDKAMPKTALINQFQFEQIFDDVKKKKQEMVVLLISRHLSGTYANAVNALKQVDYDKIYIVDTLQTTTSLAALVFHAQQLANDNKSAKEIADIMAQLAPKIKIIAVVKTLKYLLAGGRLSATSAAVGTLLGVKPIMSIVEGKVVNVHKCIGMRKAMQYIVDKVVSSNIDKSKPIYLTQTNNREDANKLVDMMKSKGYDNDGIFDIGTTVASHVGAGVVGIVYFEQ